MIRLTDLLLKSGATIAEINCVRKHVSQTGGGLILGWADSADVLSLIVSDVVGDEPGSIASGPTAPDDTTYADALSILDKYRLADQVPPGIISHIKAGINGHAPETLKPGTRPSDSVTNLVIASNIVALEAAAKKALHWATADNPGVAHQGRKQGGGPCTCGYCRRMSGERPSDALPTAILSGGETTVTIHGSGKGGRNQEFVLGFLRGIGPGMTVASVDTDGIDGATDACGRHCRRDHTEACEGNGTIIDRCAGFKLVPSIFSRSWET